MNTDNVPLTLSIKRADSACASMKSLDSCVSLQVSEFISYAVYKLWSQVAPISRRNTTVGTLQTYVPHQSIVCPPGTSRWYPAYVEAVQKLLSDSGVSLPHILLALLYVARIRKCTPPSTSTGEGAVFRILLIALVLACKFHSDDRYKNSFWSHLSGTSVSEITLMERDFLAAVRYHLHVRDDEYEKWSLTIQMLGQEHSLILKATAMQESELSHFQASLNRPDLVEEIHQIRRSRTIR